MLGPRFRQLLVLGPRAQSGRECPVVRCIRGEQLVPREARPGEHTAALKPRQDRRVPVRLLPATTVQTGPGRQRSPPHEDPGEGKKYLLAKWERTKLHLMTPREPWGCGSVGTWPDSEISICSGCEKTSGVSSREETDSE